MSGVNRRHQDAFHPFGCRLYSTTTKGGARVSLRRRSWSSMSPCQPCRFVRSMRPCFHAMCANNCCNQGTTSGVHIRLARTGDMGWWRVKSGEPTGAERWSSGGRWKLGRRPEESIPNSEPPEKQVLKSFGANLRGHLFDFSNLLVRRSVVSISRRS